MDILEMLKEIICEYVETDPDEITAESSLRYDLGASSFDLMNIGTAIEEKFKITIKASDLTKIKNVGDLVAFLENK
ncbi:MAG: acyl carrier protein [Ruminococcaceae bacterium]|nr:acyl carrier protein [Oscillospiraceae bacterium]MBR3597438.1 acyl carrier protein [Clostridia bacterium]